MNIMVWLNPLFSILAILATIAGLAIAGLLLPKVISWIRNDHFRTLLSRPFARLVLWISLGALFSFPLIDFITWLRNLVQIVALSSAPFTTSFGPVSLPAFSAFPLVLVILVYGSIYWLTRNYLRTDAQVSPVERFFIISSIASLVYRGINNVFSYIFSMNLPLSAQPNDGFAGLALQWLIGLLLLIVILGGLNVYLPNHPVSGHK